jgi:DNA polymerase-1
MVRQATRPSGLPNFIKMHTKDVPIKTGPTIYLIDGSGYIYRAYHAIRGLTNSKGLPTNAVLGFTRMLMKLLEERTPSYIAMCLDTKGPTFRHQLYQDYKANRPPMPDDLVMQLPYIKSVIQGFNLPMIELPGYEADDLIGTIARQATGAGFEVIMVTGDKDFIQLVSDSAVIYDPMKDQTIDRRVIEETYGVAAHQMIDVMGFSGDTSDNIPGIPGIGPKTALKLIKKYGSMERLYQQVDSVTPPQQQAKLLQFRDQAMLSKTLVTIDTQAPLTFDASEFKARPPDTKALSRLFRDLEFRQLQRSIPGTGDLSSKQYVAVLDVETLKRLVDRLARAERFALDTETTSTDPMRARLVGLSFALQPDEAFYLPCGHDAAQVPAQLDCPVVLKHLKPILEDPKIQKIGQNIKYDWMVLARHGVQLAGVVFDTMVASYLLNPSKRSHSLYQIALDFLDHKMISYEDVVGKGAKDAGFNTVPLAKATPYACEDADMTLAAYMKLKDELTAVGLLKLLQEVEMPLVPVLMGMQMQGIAVDDRRLHELSRSFEHQLLLLEQQIYALAGEEFNIKSSQQLGHILFEKLKLPIQKKTRKTKGYSTDVDVLTVLAQKHELPDLILRHRTLAKLKSTYTDALLDLIHPETGRIHTSYNQTVTATGRLSSSDPNLQNIPIRTEEGRQIRGAFVPRENWFLVSADYSQIELRILAHYSEDPILIKAFEKDEDIHTRTASEVFQVFSALVTPDLRRQAKIINFGIIYGMSPFGLSKALGISRKMAQTYIENYFNHYRGVKAFIDRTIALAQETRQTSTLLGRIRLVPDIASTNGTVRQAAERVAINTPIQGTAADLIKVAMIKMEQALKAERLRATMLLSVHDELVFEVPPEELETIQKLVTEIMEGVWDLKIPLKVNLAWGRNWAEAH